MLNQQIHREVKRLRFRTRKRVEDLLAGGYQSTFKGSGIEFAEVRAYEPGDDVRSIDWNVTARTGQPFIKRFVEERLLTVVLVVDISASEAWGTAGRPKRRLAAEVGAALASAAARSQDRVGLCLFTDRVEMLLPPRKSRLHLMRVLRELLAFEPAGRGTDMGAALDHLGAVLKRRALVFLMSDFLDPPERYARAVRRFAGKHELVAVRLRDPRELDLPRIGLVRLRDAETGRSRVVDLGGAARKRFRRALAARVAETDRALATAGVDSVELRTDEPFMPELVKLFRRRERRR